MVYDCEVPALAYEQWLIWRGGGLWTKVTLVYYAKVSSMAILLSIKV